MKTARHAVQPASVPASQARRSPPSSLDRIPHEVDDTEIRISRRVVPLSNLHKPFWPQLGITKRDLLEYYASVAKFILPHLKHRAMVMKRYPNGAEGEFFFMKRAPSPRPDWIEVCSIPHGSGNVIDFPLIQD